MSAAQAFYADSEGIFSKNGLDVNVQSLNNGAAIGAAMAAGSLDIGFGDVIIIANGNEHGLPFAFLAAGSVTTVAYPSGALIVRGDSSFTDGKSFDGKTIACNAVNTAASVVTRAWVDGNGGDSSTLKFVEIPLPQMIAAVEQGIVAGAYAGEPFYTIATQRGLKVLRFVKGTLAPNFMGSGWFADRSWIAKNRRTASRFAAAMREAAVWANGHWIQSQPILAAALKISPNILQAQQYPVTYGEALRTSEIQPVIDAAVRYGVLARRLRADEIIAQV